jgi:hypothetical protein
MLREKEFTSLSKNYKNLKLTVNDLMTNEGKFFKSSFGKK